MGTELNPPRHGHGKLRPSQAPRCSFAGASSWASWHPSPSAWTSACRSRCCRLDRNGGFEPYALNLASASTPVQAAGSQDRAAEAVMIRQQAVLEQGRLDITAMLGEAALCQAVGGGP